MNKGEDSVCHGSNVPCGNNPKAASDIPSSSPAPVTATPPAPLPSPPPALTSPNAVRTPAPPPPSAAQKRVFDDMVSGRSGMSSDPLSDGSNIPSPLPPPPQPPVGLCNASWEGKPSQPCLDGKCYEIGEECDTNGVCKTGCCSRKDESSPYYCVDRPGPGPGPSPGSGSSTPEAVQACDVMAIHNRSANNSTYGQWFPKKVQNLNLSQTHYEHAGRKFLNEESIKKGVRSPMILDSEAEVLGRLLWRVHLAAITQNCMNDSPASVKTTMRDELALMRKVHKIQNMAASTSLNGCSIDTTCQPKQSTRCPTTGMMTQITNPLQGENRPSATSSINSTVPTMTPNGNGTYKYTGYTTDYRPRNPNLKPKPYNSIMDIF